MKNLLHLVQLTRHCERNGISLRQLSILVLLRQKEHIPTQLAEALAISPAAITGQANTLSNKGYIEEVPIDTKRAKTPADRRRRPLRITSRGTEVVTTASASLLQSID